ncbi:MAG TPA: OmpA family protein [Gammaproteobacteria bacterium]
MYTGTPARDWTALRAQGAAAVQRAEAGLPWEQEAPRTGSDQDTWLLSFIDVLTLLLTLFVLLLAYQRHDGGAVRAEREAVVVATTNPAAPPRAVAADAAQASAAPVAQVPTPVSAAAAARPSDVQPAVQTAIALSPYARLAFMEAAAGRIAEFTSDQAFVPVSAAPWKPAETHPLLLGIGSWTEASVPAAVSREPESAADATPQPVPAQTTQPVPAREATEAPLQRLLADLEQSALAGRVEVNVLPDAVNLEISDNVLFAPASAALTGDGRGLLGDLASTLKTLPYALSVEGHTDNVPIRTARYPSNWELAAARASAVTRHLIEQGVAADRVRAIGYADTRPRAENSTAEGRARNRRVSFILRMSMP